MDDSRPSFKDPRWNRYNPARNYRRLVIHTEDNKTHLPPDYIPALKAKYGENHNLLKAHLYGEFCPLYEGNAYPCYIPSVHDIDDVEPNPYQDVDLTFDFNANPVAWSAIQRVVLDYRDSRKSAYGIIHEAQFNNTQLDDAVAEFCAKFPVIYFRDVTIRLYGDRSGHSGSHKVAGSDFETIKRLLIAAGYRNVVICANRSNPPETASVDALNRLFLDDLLFVCRRCKLVKRSLQATTWQEGKRKLDKPAGETWTHHADGLKYWAWQETRNIANLDQGKIYGRNW